jgi:hypothetical protein
MAVSGGEVVSGCLFTTTEDAEGGGPTEDVTDIGVGGAVLEESSMKAVKLVNSDPRLMACEIRADGGSFRIDASDTIGAAEELETNSEFWPRPSLPPGSFDELRREKVGVTSSGKEDS